MTRRVCKCRKFWQKNPSAFLILEGIQHQSVSTHASELDKPAIPARKVSVCLSGTLWDQRRFIPPLHRKGSSSVEDFSCLVGKYMTRAHRQSDHPAYDPLWAARRTSLYPEHLTGNTFHEHCSSIQIPVVQKANSAQKLSRKRPGVPTILNVT